MKRKDSLYLRFVPVTSARVDSKELQPYIDRLLCSMGHAESFISDESRISDFIDITFNKRQKEKWLKSLEKNIGIKVCESDFLVDVAEKMKNKNKE